MTLSKSLAELDAVATELLNKSVKKEEDTELTPDEIAEDSVKTEDEITEDESEENKKDNDTDKDEDKMEKSEDIDDEIDEENEDENEEDIEKSEDIDDEIDDEDEEVDDEDTDEDVDAEEVEKSMKNKFQSDSTISKAMQDSEFFSAVVEVIAKSMSDVQYDILSKSRTSEQSTQVLAKSLRAALETNNSLVADNKRLRKQVRSLEKSMSEGFEKLSDMIEEISSQPVGMRKSVSSISVHDRDFEQSINGKRNSNFDSLSKSQVLSILNNELYTGNQNVTVSDIISYESGAPLRQDLQSLVENKCR